MRVDPLHEGEVERDEIIRPWHGFEFNQKTGECSLIPNSGS